jgi:hypothetical protein
MLPNISRIEPAGSATPPEFVDQRTTLPLWAFPCARLSPSWRGQDPFRVYTEAGGDSWQTAILLSEHT